MDKFVNFYNCARDRGDQYMVILQKKQEGTEPLTFAVSGNWGKVELAKMNFCGSDSWLVGGSSEWDYTYVARFPLDDSLEEHKTYLRSLDFRW